METLLRRYAGNLSFIVRRTILVRDKSRLFLRCYITDVRLQMFSLLSSRMCVPLMDSIYICLEYNRLLQSIRFRGGLIPGQPDSLCG